MFLDEADITVKGGDGGNGSASFRREKFVPYGGPDGGDGGKGGSVFIQADTSVNTLYHLTGKHHWNAPNGGNGTSKKCHGANGRDVTILVPPGTIIRDADYGTLLKDLTEPGESVCVAKGGKGGRGNVHFATPSHQAPREFEPGRTAEFRRLHLELKLIAQVGLIGQPNAGKSTLLRRVSAARPKVAAYPFTTLEPVLGVVNLDGQRNFVMADIPGLIEGAHSGIGLGDAFLRHVERTRVLVHIVDICPPVGDPVENYRIINEELKKHSQALGKRPQIIVANKMDLTGAQEALARFSKAIHKKVLPISGATGDGIKELVNRLWRKLHPAVKHKT
jgi:GTP-binding protein